MTDQKPKERGQYRVHCPHCRTIARVRTSSRISNEVRQLILECTNPECRHVFGGTAEVKVTISHTIRPSRIPSADVSLRQVPLRPRAANDTPPTPANDTRGPEVPRIIASG